MTATEARRVGTALSTLVAKAKVVPVTPDNSIWRVILPFQGHSGQSFHVYMYHPLTGNGTARTIVLTDGGSMVRGIRELGTPQLKSIHDLLASYGLKLMEDMTVMEKSRRPIGVRMMSYLQAWCAVDGMFRIWNATKKEIANELQPSSRRREDAEAVRSGS